MLLKIRHLKTSQYNKELALIAEISPLRINLDAICHTQLFFINFYAGKSQY